MGSLSFHLCSIGSPAMATADTATDHARIRAYKFVNNFSGISAYLRTNNGELVLEVPCRLICCFGRRESTSGRRDVNLAIAYFEDV